MHGGNDVTREKYLEDSGIEAYLQNTVERVRGTR